MVVLHIVRQTLPNVPVIFLDTGYHFAEVYEYRDRMARDWSLNLINLLPEITVAEQESQFGILNQTDPSRCCGIRKVKPLFTALENYALWFTGMRREQAKSRATMQLTESFKLPSGNHIRKISPLADWTAKDVWAYATPARHPPALALRQGLLQHRLRAMYQPAPRPQRPALRPLGRTETRVRHPHPTLLA